MILKTEIPEEVIKFIKDNGEIIFHNHETHIYMRVGWMKIDVGSDIAEIYVSEKDYPEDLKKALGPNMIVVDHEKSE